jgi:hypothetical protein
MTRDDERRPAGIRVRLWRRPLTLTAAVLGCSVAVVAAARPSFRESTMTQTMIPDAAAPESTTAAIKSFRVDVPEADLVDLRRRLAATRWPDKETVGDASQGVQLARLQKLVRYWATDYDWRKAEATLNALPQFTTTIDGVDIHFIHVRSRHPNALPLLIAHGWPGSVF